MKKILIAILMLGLAIPPATAQGSPPPKTRLRSGDTVQKGLQSSYCWDGTCADYMGGRWPKAQAAERGARTFIRVAHEKQPTGFSIVSYASVDENGFPAGEEESIEYAWRRVRRNGETVAWKAVFNLPDRIGHAHMPVFASWQNQGDSSWTFHLKLS
jgi:hypothetical protein